jgi:hypothetical protein
MLAVPVPLVEKAHLNHQKELQSHPYQFTYSFDKYIFTCHYMQSTLASDVRTDLVFICPCSLDRGEFLSLLSAFAGTKYTHLSFQLYCYFLKETDHGLHFFASPIASKSTFSIATLCKQMCLCP